VGRGGRSHRHLLRSLQFKFAAGKRLEFYYHFVVLKYMYLVEGCDTRVLMSGVGGHGPTNQGREGVERRTQSTQLMLCLPFVRIFGSRTSRLQQSAAVR
jgi:hypothetical protein